MDLECDLLAPERAVVTAPAGCGKSHLISTTLSRYQGSRPVLVLTHTNAGVAALRERLQREGVSAQRFRLATIDGWLRSLIGTFPDRSGHRPELLDIRDAKRDYPEIRARALALLRAGHVDDVIQASYARLIIDEYQDCSVTQHAIVQCLTALLPSCVLGDPMQAIFGWAERVADWDKEVRTHFNDHGSLQTPWRWRNARCEELGRWLLHVRNRLAQGQPVDVRDGPSCHVTWIQTQGQGDQQKHIEAARVRAPRADGRVLIIGSRHESQRRAVALSTPGAVVIEKVDLAELIFFAERFVPRPEALVGLLEFAETLLAHCSARELLKRLDTIAAKRARKAPNPAEQAALAFLSAPSFDRAAEVLSELHELPDVRVIRPGIFFPALRALRRAGSSGTALIDAAIAIREENRLMGRALPKRGVGSTLLLKGLEAEVAVVLEADALDRLNLYVAMTRGSMRLVVCSASPILGRI